MALFLLDMFGSGIAIREEGPGCYDPMPIAPRPRPPVLPPKVDLTRADGLFYVTDIYRGTGMEKVERGRVRWLRVVEAPVKRFWCSGNWNVDATQAPAMNWNCTSNKRILGRAPVEADGSAYFAVPAGRFVFFQLLDDNGMMIQSMRSGTTLQPGETAGCAGCHEARDGSAPASAITLAMRRPASALEPWYGLPRDFDYMREVQPVFDKHCVSCHDYLKPAGEALNLAPDLGLAFNTSYVDLRRRSPIRWTRDAPSARKALVKAVDDGPPEALAPLAWGSHRSRLVDVIRAPHYDVKLDKESLDRIVTWIDLNAVYYGSYASAYPDSLFGRCPLTGPQLDRLRKLTGVNLSQQTEIEKGSQVSFTRPELSPCLARFKDKTDPAYQEALAIIQAGKDQLARVPREDMPNCRLVGADAVRQEKYEKMVQSQDAGAGAPATGARSR
jgi:mono/diheme cytochrome c family protein